MKTIGNVLWLVLVGWWTAIEWLLIGAVLVITIIGIPFGIQCFKLAQLSLWPFGRTVLHSPSARPLGIVGQVIWVLLAGWWLAIGYAIGGVLLMITIIGIPFGIQSFKMAGLSLAPFGKEIRRANEVTDALA